MAVLVLPHLHNATSASGGGKELEHNGGARFRRFKLKCRLAQTTTTHHHLAWFLTIPWALGHDC